MSSVKTITKEKPGLQLCGIALLWTVFITSVIMVIVSIWLSDSLIQYDIEVKSKKFRDDLLKAQNEQRAAGLFLPQD